MTEGVDCQSLPAKLSVALHQPCSFPDALQTKALSRALERLLIVVWFQAEPGPHLELILHDWWSPEAGKLHFFQRAGPFWGLDAGASASGYVFHALAW